MSLNAPGAQTDSQASVAASRAIWLVAILFAGLMLVVGLKIFFAGLQDDLTRRTSNERARLFIGEDIVRLIQGIERDVFYMTTLNSEAALKLADAHIEAHVASLRHDLEVLQHGGVVRYTVNLNIEGHDEMVREVQFQRPQDDAGYVMEVIEIGPLVDQIQGKIRDLRAAVAARIEARGSGDNDAWLDHEQALGSQLKHLPPFFHRLNENANRLFFESNENLSHLEQRIARERERYGLMETLSIILVIFVAMAAAALFAYQIRVANRRLRSAWEEMRSAKEEAERASRAKSDFVSRMSHELRTPMNAILGFAQLLQEEDLAREQRDYVDEINRAGEHLLDLINQVLDLAKIEAGRMVLESTAYDPMVLVDEVATLVAERARAKGLSLRFFASPDLPAGVMGDPTRLRQILINLVGNAVKFTDTGSIEVRVEPIEQGSRMRFRVSDTGIGMEEATLRRLFQAFSQADESTTRRYGGTGLGLMISQDLVHAMGGHISVRSEPGRGSEFAFDLPVRVDPDALPRPRPLDGFGALLSCDEAHQGEVLRALLEALGAQVMQACASDEAQQVLAAGKPWIMIGRAGCIARLREMAAGCPHPRHRILCLGAADVEGAQADACLSEPVTYTRLKALVESLDPRAGAPGDIPSEAVEHAAEAPMDARLLLVEDNAINQMVATRMLERLGVEYDLARDGAEALDMLARRPYALVLMDVQMPVMDGLEATRRLRAREAAEDLPRTPVVAMTADALSEDRDRCLASGMDDHIAKPIEMNRLATLLTARLSGYRGAPRPAPQA